MPLEGKNILITGSTKGIGLSIAKGLASERANVIVTGRSEIETIDRDNLVRYYQIDFTNNEEILKLKRSLGDAGIKVDILINNVGTSIVKDFTEMTIEDFDEVCDLNYRSVFSTTNTFLEDIISAKGSILNILSVAIRENFVGNSLYSGSKAAVFSMMNVLREELRAKEVDVVNVLAGATSTGLWQSEMLEKYENKMMTSDEVSKAVISVLEAIQNGKMTIEELVLRPKKGNI